MIFGVPLPSFFVGDSHVTYLPLCIACTHLILLSIMCLTCTGSWLAFVHSYVYIAVVIDQEKRMRDEENSIGAQLYI